MSITRKKFEMNLLDFVEAQKRYLAECEEYREKGWRHHYCFHGANMWVDHDCACGRCESSEPDEHTSLEDAREWFNEWYGTNYEADHLLWKFESMAWGGDQAEVIKIHRYEAQRIPGLYPIDYHNVICTLALLSDGTEFEMAMGTDELVLANEAERIEADMDEEFVDEW